MLVLLFERSVLALKKPCRVCEAELGSCTETLYRCHINFVDSFDSCYTDLLDPFEIGLELLSGGFSELGLIGRICINPGK